MIFFISSLPCEVFKHFQKIFCCFRNGGLKGQKVPRSKSGIGRTALELKAAKFKCLQGIPMETVTTLVGEVSDAKVSLKEMTTDCQSMKWLQKVQQLFLSALMWPLGKRPELNSPNMLVPRCLSPFKE